MDRLHARTGVETRYLTLPIEAYPELKSWGEANQIWIDASCELGQSAICQALTRAGLSVQDPAAIFFVSISGVGQPVHPMQKAGEPDGPEPEHQTDANFSDWDALPARPGSRAPRTMCALFPIRPRCSCRSSYAR